MSKIAVFIGFKFAKIACLEMDEFLMVNNVTDFASILDSSVVEFMYENHDCICK